MLCCFLALSTVLALNHAAAVYSPNKLFIENCSGEDFCKISQISILQKVQIFISEHLGEVQYKVTSNEQTLLSSHING